MDDVASSNDIKTSCLVMNNDTEGLKALGESLKENGRTDWLWTLL